MLPKFTRTSLLVAPNSRPEQSPSACFYRASLCLPSAMLNKRSCSRRWSASQRKRSSAFLALRSNRRTICFSRAQPGKPTGVTAEGPELKGATNLVLGAVDHLETAYSSRAFREIYKFIAGREPERIAIAPEAQVKLTGLVTGTPGGIQTNRPVAGASVEVFRVTPDNGERMGEALLASQTGSDGRWGE